MRVALGPAGAPADVFPMFGLGKALQSAGHHVILCAPEEYRSQAYGLGFQMVSSGSSYEKYLEGEESLKDPSAELAARLGQDMAMQFVSLRDALREADVLIGSMLQLAGPSIAEQFDVVYLYAVTSTYFLAAEQHPHFAVPLERRNRGNLKKVWDRLVLTALNRERRFSGLPAIQNLHEYLVHSGPVLTAVDPSLVSTSADHQMITGFWFYDAGEEPDLDLSASTRFVFISDFSPEMKHLSYIETLSNAMLHQGMRPLLGRRWKFLKEDELPEGCSILQSEAYSSFFPRISAVVHSGNSEIVAQAGRFGIPQIVIPRLHHHRYWSEQIAKVGVGSSLLSRPDPEQLVDVIRKTIEDQEIQQRCKDWANQLQSQNGTQKAVEAIERLTLQKKPELRIS